MNLSRLHTPLSRNRNVCPSLLTLCLTACSHSLFETSNERSEAKSSAEAVAELESELTVSAATVFIPSWEGAAGFSPGKKYVLSSADLLGGKEGAVSDGDTLIGLPADGSPAVLFSIEGERLKSDYVAVTPVERGGEKFRADEALVWIVSGTHGGQPVDAGKVRLMTNLDEGHRPYGEQEHQLNLALDLNSDGKPDYAEFTHHCKAEPAPYPIADEQRAAWEAEHGETDWDLTCTNVYTIDHGKWTKGERKTPA